RYYWPTPAAQRATQTLLDVLSETDIPRPLISQYLGQLDAEVAEGRVQPLAHELLIGSITRVLDIYADATGP
ncbi:MAG: tagatose-bisphosphate aldolase, partial [Mesorhizobium sp.]